MTAVHHDPTRAELLALVTALAADSAAWRPLVHCGDEGRHFEQLWRDEHVDVWVISWADGADTGFHDHDVSRGAVAVVVGEVVEERLVVGGEPVVLRRRAGDAFDFDESYVHRMSGHPGGPAVTIHAYSPPLSRMGAYAVGLDGTLRRESIPYVQELRPVGAAA